MSFLDKVKNMVNVSEDDYYDELESDDFQTAEFQLKNGFIDDIVPYEEQREYVAFMLKTNKKKGENNG